METVTDDSPLASRECGECTVCCTVMTIDEPELQKPPGQTCGHCVVGSGCAIHATRPTVCRVWFCGWRQLDWVSETLRPDRSNVVIYLTRENLPAGYPEEIGLEFMLLAPAGLNEPGFAEAVTRAIRGGLATFLCVPGPLGRKGEQFYLNDDLGPAAAAGRTADVRRDLRKLAQGSLLSRDAKAHAHMVLRHARPPKPS